MKRKVCLLLILLLMFTNVAYAADLKVSVPNGYVLNNAEVERLNLVINNKMKEENNEREDLVGYVIPVYNLSTEYLFNNANKTLEDSFVNKGNAIMIIKDKIGPFMQVGLVKSNKGLIVETYSDISDGLLEAITLVKSKNMSNVRYLSIDQTSKPSILLASEGKVNKAIAVDLLNDRVKNNTKAEDAILETKDVYEQIKQNKIADMELTVENLKKGEPYKTDQVPLFKPVEAKKSDKKSPVKLIIILILVVLLVVAAYFVLMKMSSKKGTIKKKKAKKTDDDYDEGDF
ncbi:hypothetical protein [Fenollaria massiliensis]|uniref:Uncharacterized protein n=1 Tax=Fenollaria massiliensis TaxID=938288 RepID=A0A9E7ITJ8_9FIRM|nr:hypothetical protein [Fenollaria massiliensis]UQK58597.1 hypothetical protein M1R53_04985 [Fenollaria massiliensis]